MQLFYLQRLTMVFCTVVLIQFVGIEPCLAELEYTARPNVPAPKGPPPVPLEPVLQGAGSTDSSVQVALAAGSDAQGDAALKQGTSAAEAPTTISNNPSTEENGSGFWRWVKSPSVQDVLSRFAPALAMYYKRSIADEDSSDFGHSFWLYGGLSYSATPSLIFSTELYLYREIGEEYERFVASNWYFDVTKTFDLWWAGVLYSRVLFQLPTNPDNYEYLTYRGTLGAEVDLKKYNFYKFHKDHAIGGATGLGVERRFHAMTHNETGYPNRLWNLNAYATLKYHYRQSFMFAFKFKNYWYWYPDGDRANDVYQLSASINYSPIKQLWLGLSTISEDRTFLYDQVTSNVALYAGKATSVIFAVTFLPRIPKTHELSR